jgi:hypothetical protein
VEEFLDALFIKVVLEFVFNCSEVHGLSYDLVVVRDFKLYWVDWFMENPSILDLPELVH